MKALKLGIVLLVTAACLLWVLWGIEWSEMQVSLSDAQWIYVVPVFGVYLFSHCIRSLRLRILLDRPDIPFSEMFAVTAVGFLAINVVPLRLGEFVRPYMLLERDEVPFGQSLAAIFVERLLDLLCLMGLLLAVGFFVDLPAQGVVVEGIDVFAVGQRVVGTLIAVGLAGLVLLLVVGEPLIRLVARLVPVARIEGLMLAFHGGLVSLVRRPLQAAATLAMSALMWTGICIGTWFVMLGFEDLPARWDTAMTTWTITITGMTVAPTPGFFGSYEAFCTASLLLWGVDREVATTFALVFHLTQFLFIVGLGGSYLFKEGISLRKIVADSREAASA